MKHLRVLGLAALMIVVLGLSGCDTGNNDNGSQVNNAANVPPAETEPENDINKTVSSIDSSLQNKSDEEIEDED